MYYKFNLFTIICFRRMLEWLLGMNTCLVRSPHSSLSWQSQICPSLSWQSQICPGLYDQDPQTYQARGGSV